MGKRKATTEAADEPASRPLRLEYVDPADLAANDFNWRNHPPAQLGALGDAIAEVGWAGALLWNERTKRLIDGHARKELFAGKGPVPVLVGSWSDAEEKKILATLDPLAGMAEADKDALAALLADVQTDSETLAALLKDLAPEEESPAKPEPETNAAPTLPEKFEIVIECEGEHEQRELFERFQAEGLKCRVLIF